MALEHATSEVRPLLRLGVPIVITQLGQMLLGMVEMLYAGRLGVHALDAVSLGTVWQHGTMWSLTGVVIGYDPLVSQAFGAGRGDEVARALQRALLIALALSCLIGLSWLYTAEALVLLGQQPQIAADAGLYVRTQLFSVPAVPLYAALSVWLSSRGIVRPGNVVMICANVFNALVSYPLVLGRWGIGIRGAAISIGLTRVLMVLVLVGLVLKLRLHQGAWAPWSRRSFDRGAIWRQLALGLPNGFSMGLELWAFQIGTLLAGRIGHVALGAHAIALNLASLLFMVPLGMSIGTSIRVGQLIGAGAPAHAQRAAQAALKLIGGYATVVGAAVAALCELLPRIYTSDPEVIALAASALPIAGAFQVVDGVQAAGTGVLRGMGKPHITAIFNAIGYFAIGIPLAWYLGLHTSLGLRGVWLGYAAGLSFVASAMVGTVLLRGPRTAVALVTSRAIPDAATPLESSADLGG